MSEDREQAEERDGAARPVTAAARRERRASARQVAPKSGSGQTGAASADAKAAKPKVTATTEDEGAVAEGKKGRPTPARDRKQKRPNVFKRLLRFLREVVSELRKVIWPTRKMLVTYTIVVLVFVAVMVALVYGLDFLFVAGISWLFGK
ncbi:preprotein translocase subunit SecE [Kutzneria viridogrisea]|uniref:Protein translocase subunit SecE n=1 Tax=Kutzneria viridogrisea TaxID=47990 RepID=A0ABR6BXF5_9PSEU|nr:preprotein translocase subunit SecE [Kutzneria viridogrisea]